MESNSM
jgi:hypothetical protein